MCLTVCKLYFNLKLKDNMTSHSIIFHRVPDSKVQITDSESIDKDRKYYLILKAKTDFLKLYIQKYYYRKVLYHSIYS